MNPTAVVAILATGIMMMATTASSAQVQAVRPTDCRCSSLRLPVGNGVEALGVVTAVTTDVVITRPAGLVAARPGAPLSLGTRVMTGPDSLASLLIGRNCRLDMAPDTVVIIAAVERQLCVRTASLAAEPGLLEPGLGFSELFGGLIAVAGAATVIDGVSDDDDTESVSRGE